MNERRREQLYRIAEELETLRESIHQLKAQEEAASGPLHGKQATVAHQSLERAFDDLRDSINHMEEVLAALAEATGEV